MGIPLFLFNWDSTFTGTSIYQTLIVFLYQFVFSSINIIIYGIYDKPYSKKVLDKVPAIYLDGIKKKKNPLAKFLSDGILLAILQSLIIYYMSILKIIN